MKIIFNKKIEKIISMLEKCTNEEIDNLIHLGDLENNYNKKLIRLSRVIEDKNSEIESKKEELNKLDRERLKLDEEHKNILTKYNDEIILYKNELENYSNEKLDSEISNFKVEDHYQEILPEDIKLEINNIKSDITDITKMELQNGIQMEVYIDDSAKKGEKLQLNLLKIVIKSFITESDLLIKKVNPSNYNQMVINLGKKFETGNKLISEFGIKLDDKYLELKRKELKLFLTLVIRKNAEKENEKERKRRLKEEKKRLDAIEKDRKKTNNEIERLEKLLLSTSSDEHLNIQLEIDEKRHFLEELEEREKNNTSGYVYIISNKGSLKNDYVKIGLTRRENPEERISELSSASVPFKFDKHAIIYSDNAFKLEDDLHKFFKEYQVNKANNRKEFFDIDLDILKNYIFKNIDSTIEWDSNPVNFELEETKDIEMQKTNTQI